ncbi:hypothetical protein LWI28_028727 [Acer negundo]|uniref:Uncharacterized protein n=1 Tax=Acer negundo TaxID=4023 RepID=A0AAD5J1X8_ACENE|nr:hypothetical protein LWI28_028727 [Acer negundo]
MVALDLNGLDGGGYCGSVLALDINCLVGGGYRDHISLISLVHETFEGHTGKSKVSTEKYDVRVLLPWCDEVVEVHRDAELIQVFKKFQEKGLDEIVVQVEQKPDFLQPSERSSCVPNAHFEVLEDNYQPMRWNELDEMSNYESDNEEVGGVFVGGKDVVVGAYVVGGEVVGDDDIFNECMRLFEGYQSKSDDEFDSDSDREQPKAKAAPRPEEDLTSSDLGKCSRL